MEKLAGKHTRSIIRTFTDIDPKQKGFVSRYEVESLFRAWEIPIGPASLCQMVDNLCPPCGISTSYPTCGLVDYCNLLKISVTMPCQHLLHLTLPTSRHTLRLVRLSHP